MPDDRSDMLNISVKETNYEQKEAFVKHHVRIVNFSIKLGETLEEPEEEMAQLLEQGFEIVSAAGYTVGQSGPHHGGAFVILVKKGEDNHGSNHSRSVE